VKYALDWTRLISATLPDGTVLDESELRRRYGPAQQPRSTLASHERRWRGCQRSVVMLMLITLRFGGDAALDHVRSGHAGCGWDLLSLSPIRPDDPLAGVIALGP
jgi:hypothetical protein